MNRLTMYDIIYSLAAMDGREAALFGDYAPAAREAFSRSLVGESFPEIWLEIPLTGEPWLDFHALTSRKDIADETGAASEPSDTNTLDAASELETRSPKITFSGQGEDYANALAWFAAQEPHKVRQIALSYDTHLNDVDHPAVQLLVNGKDLEVPVGFLKAAGRPDAEASYRAFAASMPANWYACYVGVFPGRQSASSSPWVRVECIVGDKSQRAYAEDAGALRNDLAAIGLERFEDGAIEDIQTLARSPFPLELQFNIGADGAALPTVSASVRFQPEDWTDSARTTEIMRLASWLQSRSLADGRCVQLAKTTYAKRATRNGESVLISCFPAFVKLRFSEGEPTFAKAYLMALLIKDA